MREAQQCDVWTSFEARVHLAESSLGWLEIGWFNQHVINDRNQANHVCLMASNGESTHKWIWFIPILEDLILKCPNVFGSTIRSLVPHSKPGQLSGPRLAQDVSSSRRLAVKGDEWPNCGQRLRDLASGDSKVAVPIQNGDVP